MIAVGLHDHTSYSLCLTRNVMYGGRGLFSFHFMCVGVLSHLAIGFSAPVLQFTVSMAFGRTAVALNSCVISSTSFCLSFSIFFFLNWVLTKPRLFLDSLCS